MPAYRAEKTLEDCYRAIPLDVVDEVLLVDDASDDATLAVAARLGIRSLRHPVNRGYGGNQKTCYRLALDAGADIDWVPDYADGTPLDAASRRSTRQENVVGWLRSLGAASTDSGG